jgi:hypothetical protein
LGSGIDQRRQLYYSQHVAVGGAGVYAADEEPRAALTARSFTPASA